MMLEFHKRSIVLSKKSLIINIFFLLNCFIIGWLISFLLAPLSRDFQNYKEYFFSLSRNSMDPSAERFEFGFQFLSKIISKVFTENIIAFYTIFISISLYGKYYLLKLYNNGNITKIFLLFFGYLISFAPVFELNQIRASMAISFGFLSFYYFEKQENLKFIFFFFLAFSMHYSAIIFLAVVPIILLVKRGHYTMVFIIITSFCIIAKSLLTFIEVLNPISLEYRENYDMVTFGFKSITLILPLVFLLYSFLFIKNKSKTLKYLLIFLYSTTLFSVVVSDIPVYAIRILEMSEVAIIFMAVNKKYKNYHDLMFGFLIFLILFHKFIAYVIINPLFII
jgi:hypothetical protein